MIKTWQQRCEEHPDHEGIVSEGMIWARMQEEIDELRQICRNVYEIWANSEGIPVAETCTEGYLLHLIKQMRDEAEAGLSEKPPVKTYCGGKPNYCTPVDDVNISAERVDETAKRGHGPVAYLDEGLGAFYWANDYKKDVGFTPLYAVPPHRWSNVTDEALMQEVRRRGFVIRDAQIRSTLTEPFTEEQKMFAYKKKWVGLTDEAIWLEYQHLWPFHPAEEPTLAKDIAKFARAIEAKLKEKNT